MDVALCLGLLTDAVTVRETFPCRKREHLQLRARLSESCPPCSSGQSVVRLQQSAQSLDADNFSRIINRISPARILFLESNDQIYNLLGNRWSAGRRSVLRAIILLSHEFPKPPHDRVRRKQFCALLQHLSAESLGLGRHPHSLAVAQPNTFFLFFLMLHKDSYLFSEIVNGLVELFVDTVSQVRSEGNP